MKSSVAEDAEFLESIDQAASVIDLHRSNLLRLQAEEMIQECALELNVQRSHVKWAPLAHEYVTRVSRMIENMPTGAPVGQISSTPFSQLSDKTPDLKLPKLKVQPAGCFAAGVGITKPSGNANVLPTLNLIVCIPNATFEPKDYLRHRYFDKRNRILWHVAQYLSQTKNHAVVGNVVWRYRFADKRTPSLLLVPPTANDSHSKKKRRKHEEQFEMKTARFRVQLDFSMQSIEWIPPLRLLPNRSNLADCQSQFYNCVLTEDSASVLDELTEASKLDYPNWREACVLAKIWCLQRGMLNGHDSFSSEHIALLLLYLFRTKQINPRMAPLQILAVLFKLIADTDWLGEARTATTSTDDNRLIRKAPSEAYQEISVQQSIRSVLVLPQSGMTEQQTIQASELALLYVKQTQDSPLTDNDAASLLELYQRDFHLGPVFLDPTMAHNYFGRISPSFIRMAQRDAKNSLDCIHSQSISRPFQYLFMTQARFWSRYDAFLRVKIGDIVFASDYWGDDRHDLGDYESIARALVSVLRRALVDRVRDIRLLTAGNGDPRSVVDSDETPTYEVRNPRLTNSNPLSPTGQSFLVIGITLDPDTCQRTVDRGPPADDSKATDCFLRLWGANKAQLRRFKDGAIVHAVVWDDGESEPGDNTGDEPYIRFVNDDKWNGGIVERIIRHILRLHFLNPIVAKETLPRFALRDLCSMFDGVLDHSMSADRSGMVNPLTANRMAIKAFEHLSEFLRKNSQPTVPEPGTTNFASRLGIPLAIDAVEPLSPALRYSELFPPIQHTSLGSTEKGQTSPGAVASTPIEVQIRFGPSSKWPTDLRAMGAAKSAMLIQLVDGIEKMKRQGSRETSCFDGPVIVTPTYVDLGCMGFVFRIRVRADQEMKLLQRLVKPSEAASQLLKDLTKQHVVAAMHHSMVHAVFTSHPTSSVVARLASRWASCHMLSGHFSIEVIELLVAHLYSDANSVLGPPGTASAGFIRFLRLLCEHDWVRQPLIVDPQCHISEDDRREIQHQFDQFRGPDFKGGPPMFLITPVDAVERSDGLHSQHKESCQYDWFPSRTSVCPEKVVLARAVKLAERSYSTLRKALIECKDVLWSAVFRESTSSFRSYSALLRVDPEFIVDTVASSTEENLTVRLSKGGFLESAYTRSMKNRIKGPRALQRRMYRNLASSMDGDKVLLEWSPIASMISTLRSRLGTLALFFFNELSPQVVAILWRPQFSPRAFSAVASEFTQPVSAANEWKNDTLVTLNIRDMLRDCLQFTANIVTDIKVFDVGYNIELQRTKRSTLPNSEDDDDSDEDSK